MRGCSGATASAFRRNGIAVSPGQTGSVRSSAAISGLNSSLRVECAHAGERVCGGPGQTSCAIREPSPLCKYGKLRTSPFSLRLGALGRPDPFTWRFPACELCKAGIPTRNVHKTIKYRFEVPAVPRCRACFIGRTGPKNRGFLPREGRFPFVFGHENTNLCVAAIKMTQRARDMV